MISHVFSADEVAVVEAVVDGLRWVVVLLGGYLAVSTAASLVVHRLHRGRRSAVMVRVVDTLTLPPIRRLVRAVAGAGVAAGALVGSAPAGASTTSTKPPVPVMRRLGDEAPVMVQTATMAEPAPPTSATEWTVRPGDHFWRIAEEVLTTELRRAPTDGETDPYWRRLITANRDRLADRENPDLLFPGQVLLLPASTGT